jgi:hypothetical protein
MYTSRSCITQTPFQPFELLCQIQALSIPTREVIVEVIKELCTATEQHGPMHSAHEGYAVILGELDELKAEVFKKHPSELMEHEAIQIAAMGIRFVLDVCKQRGQDVY